MSGGKSSSEFFSINWRSWGVLGFAVPPKDTGDPRSLQRRYRYLMWSILVNTLATCSFPFHLGFGILQSTDENTFFDSVAITVTSIGASIKSIIVFMKIKKIREMESILGQLDARIMHEDEKAYCRECMWYNVARIQNVFIAIYASVGVVVAVSFLLSKELQLLYQGWLPFDWSHSPKKYAIAITYQLVGFCLQLLQNFANDTFTPKTLCVLSSHIHMLYIRVSKIGYDKEQRHGMRNTLEYEKEFIRCVDDQRNLYELYEVIKNIISWTTFTQIFVSVANSCVAMVALLFFVTSIVDRVYYVLYIMGMAMQLFPTCYYGSDVVLLFDKLHYAAFSSNWIGQTKRFKRHMMIFTERSLNNAVGLAGGMIPINLDTFFAACKGAYSLFALIITMK